ncbi:hypothetical protein [Spirosoma aerophilum]
MNNPQASISPDFTNQQEEEVTPIADPEDTDEQDDLDVNKGIVKNIDELKEIIETNHPAPPEEM